MNFSPELLAVCITLAISTSSLCFWVGRQSAAIDRLRDDIGHLRDVELAQLRGRVDGHDDLRSAFAAMAAKIDGLIASLDRLRQDMRAAAAPAE